MLFRSMQKDTTVTFNILNCTKPIPLIKGEMKPLVFSEIDFEKYGIDWVSDTSNVSYAKNDIPTKNNYERYYYTFSFSYKFKYSSDRVYFAYSRPYTVTMYYNLLNEVKETLMSNSKKVKTLNEDELQKRIKQFINDKKSKAKNKKVNLDSNRNNNEETQLNPRSIKKKSHFCQLNSVEVNTLKQYCNEQISFKREPERSYQVENESFIYRQEILCHTLSGLPIDIITITAQP